MWAVSPETTEKGGLSEVLPMFLAPISNVTALGFRRKCFGPNAGLVTKKPRRGRARPMGTFFFSNHPRPQ
jgi:hypothetical protein